MRNDRTSVVVRQMVADNIRSLRIEHGISQARFAEMINVNRSYVNQVELGKENMSLDILVKMADGLDVPLASFFQGLEEKAPRKISCRTVKYHAAKLRPEP